MSVQSGRLVVNITGSATWRRRPVGIVRVERELLKQFRRIYGSSVLPVLLDLATQRFHHVSVMDLDRVLSDDWIASATPDQEPGLNISKATLLEPMASDRFISVGSDWSYAIPSLVAAVYGDERVLVPACFDLIPLLFPEYTPDPDFRRQFLRHYTDMARVAHAVFAISENSKLDLQEFWRSNGLESTAPPIHVVQLAGLNASAGKSELTPADESLLQKVCGDGDYVIFVSTLEPRKNHQLLLDLWRDFYRERGEACPQLLFVGMRGWGSTDLQAMMARMAATHAGKIKWLEGLSDALLARLYQHCLFAVFPSLYEGWGLAATEAMDYGKVCVIANSSSLGEATQHLTPACNPHDFPAWKATLARLIDDATYREGLEQRIQASWRGRTWDDFGDDFAKMLALDS